jgi:hypothetical protein
MCELCEGGEVKKRAEKDHHAFADMLEEAARMYRNLADGVIKPHDDTIRHEKHIFNQ